MQHYLLNFSSDDVASESTPREQAAAFLRAEMWGVDADEPHREAVAPGDLALIYLAAPDRQFIGRAEIASTVHEWTPAEPEAYPGDSPTGVLLAQVEEWDPPVPMSSVLPRIDPSEGARADFQIGVVRITPQEYETVLAVRADREAQPGGSARL